MKYILTIDEEHVLQPKYEKISIKIIYVEVDDKINPLNK